MIPPKKSLHETWFSQVLILLSFIFIFGLWSLILGQDINSDLLSYHFYNGYAFLHHRLNQDVAPAMMQTYMNPFFDVINYFFIAIEKPKVTSVLLSLFSSLTAFLIYKMAMILFVDVKQRGAYVFFALLIGVTGADWISLLATTTNDTKMCLMVIAALYCVLKASMTVGKAEARYVIAGGLIAGMATGFKLTAACYVVGLAGSLLFSDKKNYLRLCGIFLLFSAVGFLLAGAQWMLLLYQKFHSPLYPYYNNIFHSPYAPYISFNFSPYCIQRYFYHYLLLPFYLGLSKTYLFSEELLRDMRLLLIFLMALFFIFRKYPVTFAQEKLKSGWRLMAGFFVVSYIAWLCMFAVYRYMLPLEAISGIFIVYMARSFFQTERARLAFLSVISVLLIATTCAPPWGRAAFGDKFFAVDVPTVPPHAEVVMTIRWISYVIPFFPADTRFIGMTFADFGETPKTPRKLFAEVISQLKDDESKHVPLYALSYPQTNSSDRRSMQFLEANGFFRDEARCIAFKSSLDNFKLCPLKRVVAPA